MEASTADIIGACIAVDITAATGTATTATTLPMGITAMLVPMGIMAIGGSAIMGVRSLVVTMVTSAG